VAKGSTESRSAGIFFSTVLTHPIEGAFQATESVINLFETIFGLLDEACVGLDLRQRASDVQFVGRPGQNIPSNIFADILKGKAESAPFVVETKVCSRFDKTLH
jgi:hypothetical protein